MDVYVFGDSIAWGEADPDGGWASRLARFCRPRGCRLFNLSVPGDTTRDVRRRFPEEALARGASRGDLLVFAVGINDSKLVGGEPQVPPEEFRANFRLLLADARRITDKVACVGLTPVDERRADWGLTAFSDATIDRYDDALEGVCAEAGVDFIEVFDFFRFLGPQVLADGVHPDGYGHQKLFDLVRGFLADRHF
jgi:acyl-CoA thioesterase-1